MTCPVVAVAISGLLYCASGSQAPIGILSPADARQQYTIVEPGRKGFCVAGTALAAAMGVDFDAVRPYLEAHAEPCQTTPAPEQGLLSQVWHAFHDSSPAGMAEIAVDHRKEFAFEIEVTTEDGATHKFPPGTSVEVMERAITKYYVEASQRRDAENRARKAAQRP